MASTRSRLAVAGATAVVFSGLGTISNLAAADLDQWEPAQVVDQSNRGYTPALFSTQRGRAVAVYRADGAVWASSRPSGAGIPWAQPHRLRVPLNTSVGPVATGRGGGATIFLGGWAYTHMNAAGDWGDVRTFPYQQFDPSRALVTPDSALVTAGATYRAVKVAFKPPNGPWMLSPRLYLGYYTVLRGLWYDRDGRVHVLVTQDQDVDDRSSAQDRLAGNAYPSGLYEAVLHRRNGALTWGPLRQWRTGMVGDLYDTYFFNSNVLSTADGAITVLWHEYDNAQSRLIQFMRHRDAAGSWSPVRRMRVNGLSQVVSSLDDSGTTRLSYLRRGTGSDSRELVTRELSAGGTLTAPTVVDGPVTSDGFGLYGVSTPGGATLLRWYVNTSAGTEQRLYRCLPGGDCTGVGTLSVPADPAMAVTPNGAALIAGAADAVEGCPPERLCSRRLPPPS